MARVTAARGKVPVQLAGKDDTHVAQVDVDPTGVTVSLTGVASAWFMELLNSENVLMLGIAPESSLKGESNG